MNIREEIVTIKDLSFYIGLNLNYHKKRFKNKNDILIVDLIEMLIKGIKLKVLINYLSTIYDCYTEQSIIFNKNRIQIYLEQLRNMTKKLTNNIDNWCILLLYACIEYLEKKLEEANSV